MLEFIFELLFEFFGELLLQIIFELLAELGLRTARDVERAPPKAWLAVLGYVLMGAAAGGLSLWIMPQLLMHSHNAQLANLLLTPLLAGAAMTALGAWRARREQTLMRLDRFTYGYLFALSMAVVRYAFGQ
jgi:hypothetical protein